MVNILNEITFLTFISITTFILLYYIVSTYQTNPNIDVEKLAEKLASLINHTNINKQQNVQASNKQIEDIQFKSNEQIAKLMVSNKNLDNAKTNITSNTEKRTTENKMDVETLQTIINTIKDK